MTARTLSVDLHSHSNLSDGLLSPTDLVRRAATESVDVLAVTDHDTTEAIPEALEAAAAAGVRLVCGMEVSAHLEGQRVHILAYFRRESLSRLETFQIARRESRRARLTAMLDRLSALGLEVDREAIDAGADPRRSPGRPHVARALVAAGHVGSTREAFDRYLGDGLPAYVADDGPAAADAIQMIHDLPGLAVIAHPGIDDVQGQIEALAALGLDGVEAFHRSHSPEAAEALRQRALGLGLLVTGGSDFHGDPTGARSDADQRARLGDVPLPDAEWRRFDEALQSLGAP